tara:strand:- start:281 stop:544 length:264 start_codon:yes stop_codon:yes gene_type:complete
MIPTKGTTPSELKMDLRDGFGNPYRWTFKKNEDGDYKINTHGYAYSNFQCDYFKDDIEWEADEGNWHRVVEMINSGVKTVIAIKSRK